MMARRPGVRLAALALGLGLSACAPEAAAPLVPVAPPPPVAAPRAERLSLQPLDFSDIAGWEADATAQVLPALLRTCTRLARLPADASIGADGVGGTAGDWHGPCAAARRAPDGDHAEARALIERWFTPWQVTADGRADGTLTAYFEPEIKGSRQRRGAFTVPVYGRPRDLVSVDLGRFRPDLAGESLAGRLDGSRLVPYPPRAEITAGAIEGTAPVIAWTDDPVDFAIMQIQGSGRLRLDDGSVLRLGVAGHNGHKFVGIARQMKDEGRITELSMPAVRAWLRSHPDEAAAWLDRNPRYIFYTIVQGDGPLGTEGVALTPARSLAVDPRFIPLGSLVWLDATDPAGQPLRRLVMAQDTGSAIKGVVRGDLFWGSGEAAFDQAGRMKSPVRMILLLPRQRSPRLAGR